MKNKALMLIFMLSLSLIMFNTGCTGSSDTITDDENGGVDTQFIAVDPYIEGATFAEFDPDNFDPDDLTNFVQKSNPSDEHGRFDFDDPVEVGNILVLLDEGTPTHNGHDFDGTLIRYVDETQANEVVTSPLTTIDYLGKEVDSDETDTELLIDEILAKLNIDKESFKNDPLADLVNKKASEINDGEDENKLLKANIAVQSVLEGIFGLDSAADIDLANIKTNFENNKTELLDGIDKMDSIIGTAVDNGLSGMQLGESEIGNILSNIQGQIPDDSTLDSYGINATKAEIMDEIENNFAKVIPDISDILNSSQLIIDFVKEELKDETNIAQALIDGQNILTNLQDTDTIQELQKLGITAFLQRIKNNDTLKNLETYDTSNFPDNITIPEELDKTIVQHLEEYLGEDILTGYNVSEGNTINITGITSNGIEITNLDN